MFWWWFLTGALRNALCFYLIFNIESTLFILTFFEVSRDSGGGYLLSRHTKMYTQLWTNTLICIFELFPPCNPIFRYFFYFFIISANYLIFITAERIAETSGWVHNKPHRGWRPTLTQKNNVSWPVGILLKNKIHDWK